MTSSSLKQCDFDENIRSFGILEGPNEILV